MAEVLRVDRLSAGYGAAVVIEDIGFGLETGSAIAVLGRNGTGKTTLIDTIAGLTTRRAGTIALEGRDITRLSPEGRAAVGIGWVPQERGIFRSLTVEENITAVARPGSWTLDRVYALFPALKERRGSYGGQLSGGEQQMLAVGRALALNPRVLLLDEPMEGLAPIVVAELRRALRHVIAEEGLSAIIVEQRARAILPLTEKTLVLDRGRIVDQGPSRAFLADPERLERHLGVRRKGAAAQQPTPPRPD